MQDFFELSYEELIFLAMGLGVAASDQLTVNQQNILGNFLELLGQVILVANAVGSSYPPNSNGPNTGPDGVGSFCSYYRYGYKNSNTSSSSNSKKNTTYQGNSENMKNSVKNKKESFSTSEDMYNFVNEKSVQKLIKKINNMEKEIKSLKEKINNMES